MIDGQTTTQRIIAMLPPGSIESVTLGSRQPRETGYVSVSYAYARSKMAKPQELILAQAVIGQEWAKFELFKTTETVEPKLGDMITDASSVTWQIKKIDSKMMGWIFDCLCLKNM